MSRFLSETKAVIAKISKSPELFALESNES
jgi:hypothetical protein